MKRLDADLGAVLALHAHVDRGGRIVAHQDVASPGVTGQLLDLLRHPLATRAATALPSMIRAGSRLRRAS